MVYTCLAIHITSLNKSWQSINFHIHKPNQSYPQSLLLTNWVHCGNQWNSSPTLITALWFNHLTTVIVVAIASSNRNGLNLLYFLENRGDRDYLPSIATTTVIKMKIHQSESIMKGCASHREPAHDLAQHRYLAVDGCENKGRRGSDS